MQCLLCPMINVIPKDRHNSHLAPTCSLHTSEFLEYGGHALGHPHIPSLGRGNGAVRLSFPKNGLWRPSRHPRRCFAVPRRFCKARRMVCAVAYKDGIKPHPFLRCVEPLVLKFLLANGTHVINAAAWIWNWYILGTRRRLRLLCRCRLGRCNMIGVDCLPGFEPVLASVSLCVEQ